MPDLYGVTRFLRLRSQRNKERTKQQTVNFIHGAYF
jgi:hypothetical protein